MARSVLSGHHVIRCAQCWLLGVVGALVALLVREAPRCQPIGPRCRAVGARCLTGRRCAAGQQLPAGIDRRTVVSLGDAAEVRQSESDHSLPGRLRGLQGWPHDLGGRAKGAHRLNGAAQRQGVVQGPGGGVHGAQGYTSPQRRARALGGPTPGPDTWGRSGVPGGAFQAPQAKTSKIPSCETVYTKKETHAYGRPIVVQAGDASSFCVNSSCEGIFEFLGEG